MEDLTIENFKTCYIPSPTLNINFDNALGLNIGSGKDIPLIESQMEDN